MTLQTFHVNSQKPAQPVTTAVRAPKCGEVIMPQRARLMDVVTHECQTCQGIGLVEWRDDNGAFEADDCPDCPAITEVVASAVLLGGDDQWVTVMHPAASRPVISFTEADIPF